MIHMDHEFTEWFVSRRLGSDPLLNIVLPPNNGLISDDIYYWSITCRPGVYMVLMGVYAPWSRVHFKGRHQPYVRWIFLPIRYSYDEGFDPAKDYEWWDDPIVVERTICVYITNPPYVDVNPPHACTVVLYDKKVDLHMQNLFRSFVSRQVFASLSQERYTIHL